MDVGEKSSNEKRLIDADRAMEIVRNQGIAHPNAYHLTNYATLILREAPTVDAVEVVRCRECKHLNVVNRKELYAHCPKTNTVFLPFELDTREHFCSLGERKEGAE